MKCAVLPLSCSDTPRVTNLTEEWLRLMMDDVSAYFTEQSGGRESLDVTVLGWHKLGLTSQAWNDALFGVGDIVRPQVAQAKNVDLDLFQCIILLIDKADAGSAVTTSDGRYIHAGAKDVDPAIIQHELGHVFGAGHAWLDTLRGSLQYGDKFCVMGNESTKYSHKRTGLTFRRSTDHSDSGPGMITSSLVHSTWLNLGDAQAAVNITEQLRPDQGRATVTLAQLRGAPPEGYTGAPVCAWADVVPEGRLLIEYRTGGSWDSGLPEAPDANGWVVFHLLNHASAPSLQIGAVPAAPGKEHFVWKPPRLHVTVTSTDPVASTVTLDVVKYSPTEQIVWPFPPTFPTTAENVSQAFRHRAIVASAKGFVGAFPNFYFGKNRGHEGRGINVGGTIFLDPIAAEWRDIPVSELGNVALEDCLGRFRATQVYAQAHGFVGGFPNFFHADYNDGRGVVCGTILLKSSAAAGSPVWRDVPLSELGNVSLDDPEARFRATQDWASSRGFVGGFPNFWHADNNDGRGIVCGTILVHEGAQWQDVVISLDPA